ncbi:MAG TPA: Hsp20/alpha crystallin family protein [Drouetiella sp.]
MVFNGNLIPWSWGKKNLPVKKEESSHSESTPYVSLHHDMNSAFERFFNAFESPLFMPSSEISRDGFFQPRVEVKESAKEIRVSVELPGVDEKDLDVSVDNQHLIVRGEKREEKEDSTSGYYRMERYYGSFQRSVALPCEIDKDRVEAKFKRGVLSVTLQKAASAQLDAKRITVRKE